MSRTKREHELERRKRKFVPKGARRVRRFYEDEAMMESGTVVFRAHGRRRAIHEPEFG